MNAIVVKIEQSPDDPGLVEAIHSAGLRARSKAECRIVWEAYQRRLP